MPAPSEAELARLLSGLDDIALARFAELALMFGYRPEELRLMVRGSAGVRLMQAYDALAIEVATDSDLPIANVAQEAAAAADNMVERFVAGSEPQVKALVELARREGWSIPKLAKALRGMIGLTAPQLRTIERFERRLREDPRSALRLNELRDRRFDALLRGGGRLSESQIRRMVDRYRERWLRHRGLRVARDELLQASNTVSYTTWVDAETTGALPSGVRKFWKNAGDHKVRDTHIEIPSNYPDGLPLDEAFVTRHGNVRYPHDPLGPREETDGCRCFLVLGTGRPAGM